MRKIIALILCMNLFVQAVFGSSFVLTSQTGQEFCLPDNTVFKISMQSTIDSHSAKKNSLIAATLTEDLLINKKLIAPKGSVVYGEITQVRQNVIFCSDGLIGFRFNEIVTPYNKKIKISCNDFVFATTKPENNFDLLLCPQALAGTLFMAAVAQVVGIISFPIMIWDFDAGNKITINKDSLREYSKVAFMGIFLSSWGILTNKGSGTAVVV